MRSRRRNVALLVVALAGLGAALAAGVHAATKSSSTLVIWTDSNRAAAFKNIGKRYSQLNPGVTVKVVTKQFGVSGQGTIGGDLGTTNAANAPDVIAAASDWTGALSADGLVVPLHLSSAQKKLFPSYTLDALSYGTSTKNLYGLPTQIENIGLIVNTGEVKVPTSFSQLTKEALSWKSKHKTKVGIAVQQGSGGDAYHMYPFFSGLGGYIFGKTKSGTLDPHKLGVASPTLINNASMIDQWNKEGLINSAVDSSTAQNLFMSGQVPFWITGPWNSGLLEGSKLKFTIIQVPKIVKAAVPFLGVQGVMITKYASTHGVSPIATDFVDNFLAKPANQLALAKAEGRYPAAIQAGKYDKDKVLAEFGKASAGGVPLPNIPQMNDVWTALGNAWVVSTKGNGATPAAKAFKAAQKSIAEAIG